MFSRDLEARAERLSRGTDLGLVAALLAERRDEILERWTEAAAHQRFHFGRRELAISDHIPRLFDALIDLLRRAPGAVAIEATAADPPALAAAEEHANLRLAQGLEPREVVVEFRLLREEIGRALLIHVPGDVPASDALGAELLANRVFDGALQIALEMLERRTEEARADVLAIIAHDLTQPLTSARAALQIAARALEGPEPDLARVADAHLRALGAADHMATLLGRLGAAARLTLGQVELRLADVELAQLLRGVVARLDPAAADRVRLEVASGAETTGRWDATKLEEVASNLLSNALKYSPAEAPVEVEARGGDETVELRVRDRGIGLTTEEIGQLFHRGPKARC